MQHAFNFMRGTAEWQRGYPIYVNGSRLLLETALDYTTDGSFDLPVCISGRTVQIAFSRGTLIASFSPISNSKFDVWPLSEHE